MAIALESEIEEMRIERDMYKEIEIEIVISISSLLKLRLPRGLPKSIPLGDIHVHLAGSRVHASGG